MTQWIEDQRLVADITYYTATSEEAIEIFHKLHDVWPECNSGMSGYQDDLTGLHITKVTVVEPRNQQPKPS